MYRLRTALRLPPCLAAVAVCVACLGRPSEGEGEGDVGVYDFPSRFDDELSSVAYPGQSARHLLIAELKQFIGSIEDTDYLGKSANDVVADLAFFYDFKNAGGSPEEPVTIKVNNTEMLQRTFGEVGVASLDEKMPDKDIASTEPVVGFGDSTLLASEVALAMFGNLGALVADRGNGTVPADPAGADIPSPWVDANGVDWQQLIQKYLDGAVVFSQGCDDYLSDTVDGKGLLSDNTVPAISGDERQPYTALEHAWDEAFGYFGAGRRFGAQSIEDNAGGFVDTNEDGRADWTTEVNRALSKNAASRDQGAVVPTSFSTHAFAAFFAGRRLITQADGALNDAQLAELRGHRDDVIAAWEGALAASAVHYINALLQDMAGPQEEYDFLAHAKHWSELKGFLLALNFHAGSPARPYLEEIHGLVRAAPELDRARFGAYGADLLRVRDRLQEIYAFADDNVGDEHGLFGW